ncbi:phage tail tape measure protein [Pseudophaeobacter sp.]|uniref:phage tail tape measure protein n=1 Tax=Pseudophaeobacter sp. TaxID=1971739 RepID=UPI003A9698B5
MAQAVEDALIVRMEASLRKFERQMEGGRKAAVTAATRSERAWKTAGNQISANANRATTGIQRMTQMGGQGRFVLQNTANQIGDIAVQMNGGVSAAKTFGQQLPQLFGGLAVLGGPLGLIGPLLGTVAALGLPVAAALMDIEGSAESLTDRMKALEESISAVKSAQELSATSAVDLMNEYGGLADEAKAIFEINRQIASVRAQGALDKAARGVAGELGVEGVFGFGPDQIRNLEATIASLRGELIALNETTPEIDGLERWKEASARIDELRDGIKGLKTVEGNIDDLADALGLPESAAREVVAQFAAIGEAKGPQAQAQAMSDLADYINGASDNLAKASEEGELLYDQLLAAVTKALELAKIDIASGIDAGADAAERLKEELAAALALQNRVNTQESKQYSGRGGDPRTVGNDDYTSNQSYQTIDETIEKYRRSSKRRGGSAGRAGTGLKEAQRLYDATRSKAEQYAAELARIEDLHRRFPQVVTAEVRDRAVDALNESAKAAEGMAKRLESGFEAAFTALITGAGSAKDVVKSLAADLAQMAAQQAFKSLVGGLFDSSSGVGGFVGGLVASANGNVIEGGRVRPFANGGVVSSPTYFPMSGRQTGLMGEAGPEGILPLARVNGKLGVRAQGGAGGIVDVRVFMDDNGNWQAETARISGNVSAQHVAAGMAMQDRKTSSNLATHLMRKG